jgi:hypothetical protein
LDDPLDAARSADDAKLSGAVVDAMMVLISAGFVQGVAVSAVGERRSLKMDRHFENLDDRGMNSMPLVAAKSIAAARRVDSGSMENLSGVKVSNSGDRPLIEERDLDRPTAAAEPLGKLFGSDRQSIGAERRFIISLRKLITGKQPHRPEAAAVPIEQFLRRAAVQHDPQPQMLARRRLGQEHQPCHPRLEDDCRCAIKFNDDSLADSADARDPCANGLPPKPRHLWLDHDRPPPAANSLDADDPAADNSQDPAAHRFDFRKLGHVFAANGRGFARINEKKSWGSSWKDANRSNH